MATDTYNGWSNYPTWRVNLEICDDRAQFLAEDLESGDVDPFPTVSDLADYFREDAENVLTEYGAVSDESVAVSYALAFLDHVDWHEIAETYARDIPGIIASDEDD